MSDFGDLLLADATLANILGQMLRILYEAEVRTKKPPKHGAVMTSSGAADLIEEITAHPDLFPADAADWANRVHTTADTRNAMVHALAADRCYECGNTTTYVDAKKGVIGVDRSPEKVAEVTTQLIELTREGEKVGEGLTARLNAKVLAEAREAAARTQEIQNPSQWHFNQATHHCANCRGTERGLTTVHVGAAIEVHPPGTGLNTPRNPGSNEQDDQ